MNNWKTTIGGALSALGTSIAALATVGAFTEPDYRKLAVTFIIIGGLLSAFGKFFALLFAQDAKPNPAAKPIDGRNIFTMLVLLATLAGALVLANGCAVTPQQATYRAAGSVSITAAEAVRIYGVFASQGKTTVAQNQAVKAAYEKYQAAFAVLCDMGGVYSATTNTNASAAALQTAAQNAQNELADLLNLIRSFGVTL
jgi:hypothetical protein